MDTNSPDFWFKAASAAAGLCFFGFISWAGVVWNAWQDISDMLFEIHGTTRVIDARLEHMRNDLDDHVVEPQHRISAQKHEEHSRRLDVITEKLTNDE